MTILFNLDYHTRFGEELMLNILPGSTALSPGTHKMGTVDGRTWTCEMAVKADAGTHVDYFYSVGRSGREQRHEWLVIPHRLELAATAARRYVVNDLWTDTPDDAYMYSSAFTDCVAARERAMSRPADYGRTVRIKVRAPQLVAGERLALVGEAESLGAWDTSRAITMTEHGPHEWVVSLDGATLEGRQIEFKFVITGSDDTLWELGRNRRIAIPAMDYGDVVVFEQSRADFRRSPWRGAGTVIPVFSLRSEGSFGVGDFGDLRMFVDWADLTGQRIIQILPVNDTCITHTWQDSYPYNSISIYALHPQYMDFRQLPPLKDRAARERYEALRIELNALPQIDYERVYEAKMGYLRELYVQEGATVRRRASYKEFFDRNRDWLVPYAAFCHYRDQYGTAVFGEWPDHQTLTDREREEMANPLTRSYREVAFWYYVQYHLDAQMRAAHAYARSRRVILKGDIPIGISRDGVEAWVEPRYFNLNGQAGAPPDAFSVNGQNWGFPTYDWDEMLRDGCSWWVRRFRKMAEYFDAYRIDHVLGFFRIWEIPIHSVHGLLGQFSPALAMTPEEISAYGLNWQEALFTRPFITDWVLDRLFADDADYVRETFLDRRDDYFYDLKPEFDTQRKLEKYFSAFKECGERSVEGEYSTPKGNLPPLSSLHTPPFSLRTSQKEFVQKLYSLVSDVLFVRDRKAPGKFHPRIGVQTDYIYEALYDCDKEAFNRLYNDYFYRRNNQFWYNEAMKKLPRLTEATRMLVCAEDLGMVPECVPWVMNGLRILSLEIQSMPKDEHVRFGVTERNPYRSVCTISTHDMPTLRQWWDEDVNRTQAYYNTVLHRAGEAPHPMPGDIARTVVEAHLESPSMLCLLSLQDWLATDERLRLANQNAERINIPANPRHYWRYRMHLTIEQLMRADEFNAAVAAMIHRSGRA